MALKQMECIVYKGKQGKTGLFIRNLNRDLTPFINCLVESYREDGAGLFLKAHC